MTDTSRLTPEWILELVRDVSPNRQVGLDPCTFPDNPCKAQRFYTAAEDGLIQPWRDLGLVYVNEPYSRATSMPWSEKIAAEAQGRVEMVRLTRASTDTGWFHLSVWKVAQAACFLKGRPRHGTPGVEAEGAGKFPSVVVYYGDRARAFERVFRGAGKVVLL